MDKIICRSRFGREEITATPDWLRETFSSRQIIRLRQGKAVRKGSVAERRLYWQQVRAKSRKRLGVT